MTTPTEDDNYLVSGEVEGFAIDDSAELDSNDEDMTVETVLIREIRKYIRDTVALHNSFDVLNLPQNATDVDKIAVFDEMFNHKGIVHHLRQIEGIINNKVRGEYND